MPARRAYWLSCLLLAIAGSRLFLLALSKVQYAGLPLVLVGLMVASTIALHRASLRRPFTWLVSGLLAASAVGGVFVQTRTTEGDGYAWSMRMAAATDTYLGAALPHMKDPAAGLELLELPQRCRPYVGKNWYGPGMQPPPCPEVFWVPRWKIGRLVWHDPGLLWRAGRQALPLLQPFVVRAYGQVEGDHYAQAELRLAKGLPSVALWPEALSPLASALLLGLTLVGSAAGAGELLAVAWRGASPNHSSLAASVVVLGLIATYCFFSSWIGAGFIDLGRHSLAGQLALLCLVVASPCELARLVKIQRRRAALV